MPRDVKQFLRAYFLRYSGPGGLTEQDDMENWSYATIASKGAMARRLPYNLQHGSWPYEVDSDDADCAARAIRAISSPKANAMVFYGRWQELMSSAAQRRARNSSSSCCCAHSVDEFFSAEYDLLDRRDLGAWIALFADDVIYRVPLQRNMKFDQQGKENMLGDLDTAWFADTKDTLLARVEQIADWRSLGRRAGLAFGALRHQRPHRGARARARPGRRRAHALPDSRLP